MASTAVIDGPLLSAVIDTAAGGDVTIISAVSGKTIRIFELYYVNTAANPTFFKQGSTKLIGATQTQLGIPWGLPICPSLHPKWTLPTNTALVMNTVNATQTSGYVLYTQNPDVTP